VVLNYKVDDGDYTAVAMTDQGEGSFSGEFRHSRRGFVSYFIEVKDTRIRPVQIPPTHRSAIMAIGQGHHTDDQR
jgi:hypothetical protein